MKLKDLKKAWNNLSQNKELDEQQIREMLHRKTENCCCLSRGKPTYRD